MTQTASRSRQADYGLDAPGLVRRFLLGGIALVALGTTAIVWSGSGWLLGISIMLLLSGVILLGEGLYMIWSSRVGKLRARDILLDSLQLRGDERVLDVGCGRGLLLIGAAKRLPRGRAVGLDLWSKE